MNVNNIFILMVLCHAIDDFVFQPVILSKLKQRQWWVDTCEEKGIDFKIYENDYLAALIAHSASWSAMIMLPLIFLYPNNSWIIAWWIANAALHALIDNLKANYYALSLVVDQTLHLIQIMLTLGFFYFFS